MSQIWLFNLMVLRNVLDQNVTLGILCTTATLLSISCVTYYIITDHHSKVQHRQDQLKKKEMSKILLSHQEMTNQINDQINILINQETVHSLSQIAEIEENIMKTLESLDSISLSSSTNYDSLRDLKKNIIYTLQDQLKKVDLFQINRNK